MPSASSTQYLVLPEPPSNCSASVKVWREPVEILTYQPEAPNKNPMFLEKRVYQGSSGRVYPLPFIDRVASEPRIREWDAIHLENEYVRLMLLPEIGGRIHIGYDKIKGYDFFYRQNVIKPALVGLAGPWISGGVELNWPQHHRPATFMPVETEIEKSSDGSVTVWCSDHDPMLRMKGMHGVCLRPGETLVELKARLYNRTGFTQTFLWWANVATRVHEKYQSFFPSDVRFVADHAKRAVTTFPLSSRPYYGINYAQRAQEGIPAHEEPAKFKPDGSYAANDLSWYANIPVPTSYMITGTSDDFFGGYDHARRAGIVHVANHHVAPGKKQWTWGNHEFGYAWDRSLTDADGPYIELMAGAYTDNQPDFSYLAPWETKTFSQYWYPIRDLGVPQAANTEAALHIEFHEDSGLFDLAIEVTHDLLSAAIEVTSAGKLLQHLLVDLYARSTFQLSIPYSEGESFADVTIKVFDRDREVLVFTPGSSTPAEALAVAMEPAAPQDIPNVEGLYLTGLHLDQYRHATREPQAYWEEALRRDPSDSRTLNAYGLWLMRRGQFADASNCFRKAIARLTELNLNPYDGEPFYSLGQCLRFLGDNRKAYDLFYKATWNAAWRGPAYFALAELDCVNGEWKRAEDHLRRSLKAEADNLNARHLLIYVLRQKGENEAASETLRESAALDLLDIGSKWERGEAPRDSQQQLDLAFDLLRAGRLKEAERLLTTSDLPSSRGAGPMLALVISDIQSNDANSSEANMLEVFKGLSLDYCFPHRLEELLVLQRTCERHPELWGPWYLLGNLLYDKRRHKEAIKCWERAVQIRPDFSIAWRNLGIGYFNENSDVGRSLAAFDQAVKADPSDGRVLYERDQLWKRVGRSPKQRLDELLSRPNLIAMRDDLSVELATLYNQVGRAQDALALVLSRPFQPWEGGEGLVLKQYVRSRLLLGQSALKTDDKQEALKQFKAALNVPRNLGEANHLLANQSDVYYWLGIAHAQAGDKCIAEGWLSRAAEQKGDFQQMSVRTVSDMTFWSALALRELSREDEAIAILSEILRYAEGLDKTEPKIDYFATSLPAMLLFNDNLAARNHLDALFLKAQALLGLGSYEESKQLLQEVLLLDANHAGAQDLLANWMRFCTERCTSDA